MQSGAPTTGLYQSSTSDASTSAYKTVLSKAGTHHSIPQFIPLSSHNPKFKDAPLYPVSAV